MPLFSFRRLTVDPLAVSMAGVKLGERLLQIATTRCSPASSPQNRVERHRGPHGLDRRRRCK
jgi:hypothetical protein